VLIAFAKEAAKDLAVSILSHRPDRRRVSVLRSWLRWGLVLATLAVSATSPMFADLGYATPEGTPVSAQVSIPRLQPDPDTDSTGNPLPTSQDEISDPCPTDFEYQVVILINQQRAEAGQDPLLIDLRLQRAARVHSEDMAINDFFSHTGSDGSTFAERIGDQGYPLQAGGETIAAGYTTPEAVVQGWMNSEPHRAILLGEEYEHIGVGYSYIDEGLPPPDDLYDRYWTADFGSTLDARQAPPHWCDPTAARLYLPLVTQG
jgi:uncharacterized protein YkwD